MTELKLMTKTEIKRQQREETSRIAQVDTDRRLQAARAKTARLREQRLAQISK